MWARSRVELLVIGGGPAGMGAAIEGARLGLRTLLVDERPALGGQIYRQPPPELAGAAHRDAKHRRGKALIAQTHASGAELWLETVVWGVWPGGAVGVQRPGEATRIVEAGHVVLATGAFDTPIPFDGWTLPGVLTAGAAQALVKTQQALPGERLVVAGGGPQVLAFAADLARGGANLLAVAEAAPLPGPRRLGRLLLSGGRVPELLRDGVAYQAALRRRRVPLLQRHGIVRAEGDGRLERVVLARYDARWRPLPGSERTYAADALCVGYGFTPSVELARLAGAALELDEQRGGWCVRRDDWLATSAAGFSAAGDGAGIGGALAACEEGRLAAIGAARRLGRIEAGPADELAAPARRRLAQLEAFRRGLAGVYPVGDALPELPGPDAVICRCEELTRRQLDAALPDGSRDPGTVKLLTRAGMGLCQGRNCARSLVALVGAARGTRAADFPGLGQRFPVRPVRIADLAVEPTASAAGH